MFQVFKAFLKILRDPQGYRQQQEAEFEAERQRILAEAAKIAIPAKSKGERQSFHQLAEALDFIGACLESNDLQALGSEMAWSAHYLSDAPDRPYHFAHYFNLLKNQLQQETIQTLYRNQDFPEDQDHFQLGGHIGSPLGHVYIRFERDEEGWRLSDIGMVR